MKLLQDRDVESGGFSGQVETERSTASKCCQKPSSHGICVRPDIGLLTVHNTGEAQMSRLRYGDRFGRFRFTFC